MTALENIWPEWHIIRELGEGSFGKVYEIQRNDMGRVYKAALKVVTIPSDKGEVDELLSEGMDEAGATNYFHGIVEEFVEEFSLMEKLKGNTNIVAYEDHKVLQKDEGVGWEILIRMELLTPMTEYLKGRRLSEREVCKVGTDICRALELCRRYHVIHRDIKPENIFVSELGDYKLGDFGVARTVEKTMSGLSKKGTVSYMAPEIYRGEQYDSTVDIYSLGVVLYRLLNDNRAPFMPPAPQAITFSDKENAQRRRLDGEKFPRLAGVSDAMNDVIGRACAFDPKERFTDASQMRAALEQIEERRTEMNESEDKTLIINETENNRTNPQQAQSAVQAESAAAKEQQATGQEQTPPAKKSSGPKAFFSKKPVLIGGGIGLAVIIIGVAVALYIRSTYLLILPENPDIDIDVAELSGESDDVELEENPDIDMDVAPVEDVDVNDLMNDTAIEWQDPALESMVQTYLGKEEGEAVSMSEVSGMESLCIVNGRIESSPELEWDSDFGDDESSGANRIGTLEDLQYFTGLKELVIRENADEYGQPLDVDALSGLGQLEKLELSGLAISDLTPLCDMESLEELKLDSLQVQTGQIPDVKVLRLNHMGMGAIGADTERADLEILEVTDDYLTDISGVSSMPNLRELDLSGNDIHMIENLSALEDLSGLKVLRLNNTNMDDLSLISGLTGLEVLELRDNPLGDISPLEGFDHLRELDLSGNDIANYDDLSALEELPELQALRMNGFGIGDELYILSELSGLTHLELQDNDISDIEDLSGLSDLEYLDLGENHIVEIAPLQDMTGLKYLELGSYSGSDEESWDIGDIGGLTGLEHLGLAGHSIAGAEYLADMKNLEYLNLNDCGELFAAGDVGILDDLTNLRELYLSDIGITDISALAGMSHMEILNLYANDISDISALAGMGDLKVAMLSDNEIEDIGALQNLSGLEYLYLDDNQVSDISALSDLTALKELTAAGNSIDDISALSGLRGLKVLDLDGNRIQDISPLGNLTNLTTLYIEDNEITDYSPISFLENYEEDYGDLEE